MSIQQSVENSVYWSFIGMCKRLRKSGLISRSLKSQKFAQIPDSYLKYYLLFAIVQKRLRK